MTIDIQEALYLQALDYYPYDIKECIEKLQYALSAGNNHAGTHYLLGRIYDEQASDYTKAMYHYKMALSIDHLFTPTYIYYANLLIEIEEYDEAVRVIDIGLDIKGTDKAVLYFLKGILFENYEMYSTAKDYFKKAKLKALNNNFFYVLDGELKRIKEKKKQIKTKKNKKKSKK